MGDTSLAEFPMDENLLQPLFRASKSSNLKEALEILIANSRTYDGRSRLANVLPAVLQLSQSLPYPSGQLYLLLSLRLLRNLCAGVIGNQNAFIQDNGVGIILTILKSVRLESNPDPEIILAGLQVLANVSLAGEAHQQDIWHEFFPIEFGALAALQSRRFCDSLCVIIYTCCDGCPDLVGELCGDQGLQIVAELVRIGCADGFREDWLKLLLFRICLEEAHFPRIFSTLYSAGDPEGDACVNSSSNSFSSEQAYLLMVISGILHNVLRVITFRSDFAVCVFGIFKRSIELTNSVSRCKSGLPTGSALIDVLGYSLTILKDICAQEDSVDVVDTLLSHGLLELLLSVLSNLEPPSTIRKAMKQSEGQEATCNSSSRNICPYEGFRRDIVAVIVSCACERKHVQDELRQKNAILLLLQQCVIDEDNPYLREWGILCARVLLEGNAENEHAVTELELQGPVDMHELSVLGLRVELDQKTRRPKLVNV